MARRKETKPREKTMEFARLLPNRWKRVGKDYENILLSLLANGYSRTKIKNTLSKLDLSYSEEI